MTDLYETLGVAKDATAAVIKKAFRGKAKSAHPDAGGDAETFGALVKAYDVLSDDARRKRYDDTGKVDEGTDNADANALAIIAGFVERFINDDDARHKDMIAELKKHVASEIRTAERNIDEGEKYEKKVTDLRKRVKGQKGATLIIAMFDNQLRNARTSIDMLKEQIVHRERALELIADTAFEFDKRAEPDVFSGVSLAERSIMNAAYQQAKSRGNIFFR